MASSQNQPALKQAKPCLGETRWSIFGTKGVNSMKNGKGISALEMVLLVLLVIGLFFSLKNLWLPIVILGGIFLLYKFPPSFVTKQRGGRAQVIQKPTSSKTRRDRPRSKTVPFRVIEGGKDDDETPKYH